MINALKNKLRGFLKTATAGSFNTLEADLKHFIKANTEKQLELQGRMASLYAKNLPDRADIQEAEFKVYSQFGDDGIIQYLINKIDISNKVFIEFGVEDYQESNTRFLLINNNWSGLIIDGAEENIARVKNSDLYWKYNLKCTAAFITAENINDLIKASGIEGQIGILSIDVDGVDYWIWKSINIIQPDLVIIEYNSVFGKERPVTVPYDPAFNRTKAHHSCLYAGSSLLALSRLAEEKGYVFVGSNSAGNNSYFVRKDKAEKVKILTVQEGYVESQFRESRNQEGELSHLEGVDRLNAMKGLPVFNVDTKQIEKL